MTFLEVACNFKILCFTSVLVHLLAGLTLAAGTGWPIGICYGPSGEKFASAGEVVSLCKFYNITRIRLYEPNHSLLEALRGSNIQVIIGVKNEELEHLADSVHGSRDWIERNILHYWPDVRFRYIAVGNEAILGKYTHLVLPAMYNLMLSLRLDLKDSIKLTTAISTSSVMTRSNPPSLATFQKDIEQYIEPIIHFLNITRAPLLANVHPYFTFINEDYGKMAIGSSLSYPGHNVVVEDRNFKYQSVFDILIDALYILLEKNGGSGVKIVVSETGWPRKGNDEGETGAATKTNADLYYRNIINHVRKEDGTPRRRGRTETYLFAMFDEIKKSGNHAEKHWGLFHSDKKLIHDISFY